jgi:arylsulfatase
MHRLSFIPLLTGLAWLTACSPPPSKPNIIFILADDLGYGEVGCFGQKKIKTPHLDALAAAGMKLTRHYAGSPVCAPSRGVFLTGKHTGHAYIRINDETAERGDVWKDPALEGQRPLLDSEVTIAEALKTVGYRTGFIGKWGLGWPGSQGDANKQGFDHFYGYICQRIAHNYYPDHLHRNGERVALRNPYYPGRGKLAKGADPHDPASYEAFGGKDYAPDLMVEEAEAFIRQSSDQPFFLTFATPVPHLALQVPQDSLDEYEGAFEETPYLGNKGYMPHQKPRAAYAAMITRMDRDIGRLLKALEDTGQADNTLVVFSSDNGPSWVGGVDWEFFESRGGLRGRKAQLYEGGIRVPTIVRWPGKVPPGTESAAVSAFWDWMPTFMDAAEVSLTLDKMGGGQVDGISLLPALQNPTESWPSRTLYWEHNRQWQAMLHENWKLLRKNQKSAWELYNLAEDPAEERDLASENPLKVKELSELLSQQRVESKLHPLKKST